jgi:hypothetical protein
MQLALGRRSQICVDLNNRRTIAFSIAGCERKGHATLD